MYQNSFCGNFSFTIVSNVHMSYTSEVSIQNNTQVFINSYSLIFSLEFIKKELRMYIADLWNGFGNY